MRNPVGPQQRKLVHGIIGDCPRCARAGSVFVTASCAPRISRWDVSVSAAPNPRFHEGEARRGSITGRSCRKCSDEPLLLLPAIQTEYGPFTSSVPPKRAHRTRSTTIEGAPAHSRRDRG